jgi:hypothetical protein
MASASTTTSPRLGSLYLNDVDQRSDIIFRMLFDIDHHIGCTGGALFAGDDGPRPAGGRRAGKHRPDSAGLGGWIFAECHFHPLARTDRRTFAVRRHAFTEDFESFRLQRVEIVPVDLRIGPVLAFIFVEGPGDAALSFDPIAIWR